MAKDKHERIVYGVRVRKDLVKQLKLLAVELDKKQNELLEEAIKLLLDKYKEKEEKK